MIRQFKTLAILALVVTTSFTTAFAQGLKTPAASPLQTMKQAFALSDITIEYSRPSAKSRVIFGDLVPYGKVWRTGANASTRITLGEDMKVNGTMVKSGTYAIYTVPNKDNWDIMLYKDLTLNGSVADYKKENEVLRFNVASKSLADMVETFTINIADITSRSANIELSWEHTRVSFSVVADYDSTMMKNIEAALAKDTRPYYAAANYYYENGKDMGKALEWVNKAIETNPKAYWMFNLKSKIEYKMSNYAAAETSAQKVVELATEAKNDDYVKMGQEMIEKAKAELAKQPQAEPKKKKKA